MKEELIDKSILTGYVQLDFAHKIKYYELMFAFAALVFVFPVMDIQLYMNGKGRDIDYFVLFFSIFFFSAVAFLLYHFKRKKLKLTEIKTNLGREDIIRAITETAQQQHWKIDFVWKKNMILHCKGYTNHRHKFIGEQQVVIIFFDAGRILVNCWTCKGDEFRIKTFSFANHKKNIKVIANNIKAAGQTPAEKAIDELAKK